MRIKICGLTRTADLKVALEAGAFALGFVFYPLSPRFIQAAAVKKLWQGLDSKAWKVGVFVNQSNSEILAVAAEAGLSHAQLHGDESPDQVAELQSTGLNVIKALRVTSPLDLESAASYDCLLLIDAAVPGVWGGSGQVANWELAAQLAQTRPCILAGGLNANNLVAAASQVRPWAFDLSSGVESAPGIKNHLSIETLFQKARAYHDNL